MHEQLHALFTKKIIIVFFYQELKTRYPHKDWAQIRGRLLGVCNLTNEDESLNQVLNKVCLQLLSIILQKPVYNSLNLGESLWAHDFPYLLKLILLFN